MYLTNKTDLLDLCDRLSSLAISHSEDTKKIINEAINILKNSYPIVCPKCGNDNMLEGSDELDNSHEWLCHCGYQLLRQGNTWSAVILDARNRLQGVAER